MLYRRFRALAELIEFAWSLPDLVGYALARRVLGQENAFTAAFERMARVPGLLGIDARRAFYRRTLAAVGRDEYIGRTALLSQPDARLGDNVFVGRYCSQDRNGSMTVWQPRR